MKSKMSFSVWQVVLLTLGPHEKVVMDWGESRLSQSVFQHHPPLKGSWMARHMHVDGSWRAVSGASFQVLGRKLGYRGPGPLSSPLDLASSWEGTTGVPLPVFKPQVLEVTSS